MIVNIDPYSGFCFGVVNAISQAEKELSKGETLYCLGEIVHNNAEVERLRNKGMQTIALEDFSKLAEKKVLIRAHGEPLNTFYLAEQKNIHIINATCPVVMRLQKKVYESYLNQKRIGGQVVIFGKAGHPEVNGLVGQTDGKAIVIACANDIDKIDLSRPLSLFSQTTMDWDQYNQIIELIKLKMQAVYQSETIPLEINKSICGSVANRIPLLKKFATEHDVIIFIGGKNSSNGRVLYQICLSVNVNSHFISSIEEIDTHWINKNDKVGICGATSTPRWQMDDAASFIKTKL